MDNGQSINKFQLNKINIMNINLLINKKMDYKFFEI